MSSHSIYNLIILDESGSMGVIKEPTISGFNELATTISHSKAQFPEQKHFVSFVTFNNYGIKFRLYNQPVEELGRIDGNSFQPNGMTPLYDAIGMGVLKLKHELINQENYDVLVTVITDGEENYSQEFTLKEVKLIIEQLSAKRNWAFGLIGAG
ncbi:MAG: VWA domain-containing protein, partial [Bacteroidetes bacterium]|nr:VWA domain-containing protein [Bacteroidota bacterium]